jgi:hypothetical protein
MQECQLVVTRSFLDLFLSFGGMKKLPILEDYDFG